MILSAQELDKEGVLILKSIDEEYFKNNPFEDGISLKDKGWKYKNGDNLEWAELEYDDLEWEKLSSEKDYDALFKEDTFKNRWFRLHFKIDSSLQNSNLFFNILIFGATEIYLNGKKVKTFGRVGSRMKNEHTVYARTQFQVPLTNNKNYVLAIRFSNHLGQKLATLFPWNSPFLNAKGNHLMRINYYGDNVSNTKYYDHRILVYVIIRYPEMLLLLTTGLVFFIRYLFVKKDRATFSFALFTLSMGIFVLCNFVNYGIPILFEYSNPLIQNFILYLVTRLCLTLGYLFLLRFLYYSFFPEYLNIWNYLFKIWVALFSIMLIIPFFYSINLYPYLFRYFFIPLLFIELARVIIFSIYNRKENAYITGIGAGLYVSFLGLFFLFTTLKFYALPGYVFSLGVLSLISSATILLIRQNRQKEQEVLQLAEDKAEILENQKEKLEEQVQERTEELQMANEEILAINDTLTETLETIEEQRDEILSSIQYAQRIQASILPRDDYFQKLLSEHFILFKPRDVVSGDFYWLAESNSKIVLTAVDCTGHGVPGAFMSMVGNDLLNAIVKDKHISKANEILTQLHKNVRLALQQKETQTNDGMDMALVSIDLKNKILEFAGAKNPLIYIQNGELHQIKGDIMGIGGVQQERERVFTAHEIDISKPTTFYLFSDGYQDQFGGKKGRKFMTKRFRELLFDIHKKPMQEQKSILETTLKDWRGKEEQVDDILVIGVKI